MIAWVWMTSWTGPPGRSNWSWPWSRSRCCCRLERLSNECWLAYCISQSELQSCAYALIWNPALIVYSFILFSISDSFNVGQYVALTRDLRTHNFQRPKILVLAVRGPQVPEMTISSPGLIVPTHGENTSPELAGSWIEKLVGPTGKMVPSGPILGTGCLYWSLSKCSFRIENCFRDESYSGVSKSILLWDAISGGWTPTPVAWKMAWNPRNVDNSNSKL